MIGAERCVPHPGPLERDEKAGIVRFGPAWAKVERDAGDWSLWMATGEATPTWIESRKGSREDALDVAEDAARLLAEAG